MPCNCRNITVIPNPPAGNCDDCLIVNSLRLPCDDGPDPCGDTIEIDLSLYNDLEACDECVPVYSLVSFDADAFTTATVSSVGLLEATTADYYAFNEYPVIRYKVDCPCSLLSASGNVYVCFKNPCPIECHDSCDPCTGICIEEELDVEVI